MKSEDIKVLHFKDDLMKLLKKYNYDITGTNLDNGDIYINTDGASYILKDTKDIIKEVFVEDKEYDYEYKNVAELLVSKTNFQGMTKDEVIGLFYQEFSERTEVEKQYEIKYKWMLENGFKTQDYFGEELLVYNEDFYWTKEDIMYHALSEIKQQIDMYNENLKYENELL